MAIVKMKKLRVMAMADSRDRLLRALLRLGCVEIREPAIDLSDPAWEGLGKPDHAGLEKARELLEGGYQGSIQEVAALVGYDDAYHFSKLFKKKYDVPPSKIGKGTVH